MGWKDSESPESSSRFFPPARSHVSTLLSSNITCPVGRSDAPSLEEERACSEKWPEDATSMRNCHEDENSLPPPPSSPPPTSPSPPSPPPRERSRSRRTRGPPSLPPDV
eukprot:736645-Hanusia_phi.AAC.1